MNSNNIQELQCMNADMSAHIKVLTEENNKFLSDNKKNKNVINELKLENRFLKGAVDAYQYVIASRR